MDLREQIKAANDTLIEPIDVPEWPGVTGLHIKRMDCKECRIFEEWVADACPDGPDGPDLREADDYDLMAKAAICAICQADGKPALCRDDLGWLKGKSGAALKRLWRKIAYLNGMSKEAVADAKKDCSPAPTSVSA